ncbi:protein required for the hydroxylation of heme O to form heme A [Saccharomyces cerevisiae]|nr:protein required for the hydroxylation of heme O to form heme A [Saccharomyces cerevisiae]
MGASVFLLALLAKFTLDLILIKWSKRIEQRFRDQALNTVVTEEEYVPGLLSGGMGKVDVSTRMHYILITIRESYFAPYEPEGMGRRIYQYKESPEFKLLNSHIDLDEFKFIFLWSGFIDCGVVLSALFYITCSYFAVSKKTSGHVNKRLFGLAGLLGLQGFVGWWMVKSGLDQEQLDARKSKPTVSQYRLTRIWYRLLLYMGMLWTGLEILRECKWIKNPVQAISLFKKLDNPAIGPMRKISLALLAVSFLTAMSGGMVAGWMLVGSITPGQKWVNDGSLVLVN